MSWEVQGSMHGFGYMTSLQGNGGSMQKGKGRRGRPIHEPDLGEIYGGLQGTRVAGTCRW